MIKNAYYFTDDKQIIRAICEECYQEAKIEGWFWDGKKYGYGDYDLDCYICHKDIYKRPYETPSTN